MSLVIAADDDIESVIGNRSNREEYQRNGSEDEPDPIPPISPLLASLPETQQLLLREGKSELCP